MSRIQKVRVRIGYQWIDLGDDWNKIEKMQDIQAVEVYETMSKEEFNQEFLEK